MIIIDKLPLKIRKMWLWSARIAAWLGGVVVSFHSVLYALHAALNAPVKPDQWKIVAVLGLCSDSSATVQAILERATCAFLVGCAAFGQYYLHHLVAAAILIATIWEGSRNFRRSRVLIASIRRAFRRWRQKAPPST